MNVAPSVTAWHPFHLETFQYYKPHHCSRLTPQLESGMMYQLTKTAKKKYYFQHAKRLVSMDNISKLESSLQGSITIVLSPTQKGW